MKAQMTPSYVLKKIREKGAFEFFKRAALEAVYALFCLGRSLLSFFFFFNRKTLVAYYDLDFCPASYDSVWYFIAAEMERRKKKCHDIRVVFYPRQSKDSKNYGIMFDREGQTWRFDQIVLPSLSLFPHIRSYSVCFSKWEALRNIRPGERCFPYHPLSLFRHKANFVSFFRTAFDRLTTSERPWGLRASVAAKRHIQLWTNKHLKNRKLIVISLRCSPFTPTRNSKLSEWAQFAKSCNSDEFLVVFVMDTDVLMSGYPSELEGFMFFDAASWNIGIRAALYEEAYLCLGTFIGPGGLWMLNNRCRYISFKVAIQGEPSASEELMTRLGFVKGENVPWATPFQKIVWEDDDYPVIQREFLLMREKIEALGEKVGAL